MVSDSAGDTDLDSTQFTLASGADCACKGSVRVNYQVPGDANQDGTVNIGDAIWLLNHLFGSGLGYANLPCEGGTYKNPGSGDLALLDWNGDGTLYDIADAIAMLSWLFGRGPAHRLGTKCLPIAGCPNKVGGCPEFPPCCTP